MRFTISAAALAFAATAFAQTEGFDAMSTPTKDEYLTAGTTYSIVWEPSTYTGSVTLSLLGGSSPSTLQILGDLGTVDNSAGSYSWAIDSSLGDLTTYGIKITLGSDSSTFQYSFPFHINGASSSSSASATASGYPVLTTSSSASQYPVSTPATTTTTSESVVLTTSCSTSVPLVTAPSSAVTYPVVSYPVGSPSGNLSTAVVPTTLASVGSTTTSASASQTSQVVVNGAPRAAAGSIALLGAVAAAVFAL